MKHNKKIEKKIVTARQVVLKSKRMKKKNKHNKLCFYCKSKVDQPVFFRNKAFHTWCRPYYRQSKTGRFSLA